MKPVCQFSSRRAGLESGIPPSQFPQTDYFFQSRMEEWRGFSSPHDGREHFRNFRRLSREYYGAAAQEYVKEAIVFGLVVAASLWPVIYMIVVVVKLLSKKQP